MPGKEHSVVNLRTGEDENGGNEGITQPSSDGAAWSIDVARCVGCVD